ncbi:hypothetical protein [Paenibacillus aestuarii]|uniref:Zinc finger FPG/IleRS-type domain-containing protein n=1 Tax=Paenibacillus aestuarii TaxID=516965 RepID=A0ABW0K3F4_9BACL|nr:hypothetical protein [Paenibacillus aestuarii]
MIRQREYELARQDAYYNGDYDAIERIIDAEAIGARIESLQPETENRVGLIHRIDPGTGAIAYALEYVSGLTREEAAPIISELCAALPLDKRVKQCAFCWHLWRDDSRNNTKQTCCDDCKRAFKTLQKRNQRTDKALLAGVVSKKKKTKREENYIWWHEYPFWLNEYEMLKQSWKYEVPYETELIDAILGQRLIYGEGNRKVKNGEDEQDR